MSSYLDIVNRLDSGRRSAPQIFKELAELIDAYIEGKDEVRSRPAGSDILKPWNRNEDYTQLFLDEGDSSKAFGIILKEHLIPDSGEVHWEMKKEPGGLGKIYVRKS